MFQSPTESKIPIFHNNPLKSKISKPLSTLSSRLRAHLDADGRTSSTSSVLFGFLNATGSGGGRLLKNVNPGKTIAVASRIKNVHYASSSHDDGDYDLNKQQLTRPTNICISGQHFPSTTTTKTAHEHYPITGVEHVGRRVRLNSGKEGVLRFVGKTQFGEGVWCGVELDNDEGTSDGVANNVRYFSCPKNRGVFVLISNLSLIGEEVRDYVSDVSDSGPHSLLGVTGDVDQLLQNDATTSDAHRCSSSFSLQEACCQTPATPNSSNSSYVAPNEWKCASRNSSSASSLVLNSLRGLPSSLDPLTVHMSKHSSIECEDSLGILTPDQMADLTVYKGEGGNVLGAGGSCDDFRSLALKSVNTADIRCPSMENIMNTPMPPECLIDICEDGANSLFGESDACCIMTSSTISESSKDAAGIVLRSPSLEELLTGDLSTTLVAAEQMDSTDTGSGCVVAAAAAAAPPTSFVTSVTSIGSWDNGYQGDGECSRPTSRGGGGDRKPMEKSRTRKR
jgi:hypothetical protein